MTHYVMALVSLLQMLEGLHTPVVVAMLRTITTHNAVVLPQLHAQHVYCVTAAAAELYI